MRAVQITALGQPLEEQDLPEPKAGPGDLLVRITAAGICHSDVHYRDGVSPVARLPITPGHEIAGSVVAFGSEAGDSKFSEGDRVCLHYLVTCGDCDRCRSGKHQWCASAEMLGKDRDGGYAEYIAVPTQNAIRIPDNVNDEHAAVMMCSSATSLHAIRKARLQAGDAVAVFGCGGLGASAIQIARILGGEPVIAIDRNPAKLALAGKLGARPVDASRVDPVEAVHEMTNGLGVDVALELVGSPVTVRQAVMSAAVGGRVALAGITNEPVTMNPYVELIRREIEVVGVSDHLPDEIAELFGWAASGSFDLSDIVAQVVPLDPFEIERVLSALSSGDAPPRTVVRC